MIKRKMLYYIAVSTFIVFIFWVHHAAISNVTMVNERVIKEAIHNTDKIILLEKSLKDKSNVSQTYEYKPEATEKNNSKAIPTDKLKTTQMETLPVTQMKKPRKISTIKPTDKTQDLKYMLIWNDRDLAPLSTVYFRDGQESFIYRKCAYNNCYVTADRNYFRGDLTKFDVIAFNGRNVSNIENDFPKQRSPNQKYIYFNMESADNFPVCHPMFDNFFNWTATYKLDSDIPFPYIVVKKEGEIAGPKINMDWPKEFPKVDDKYLKLNKTIAAAWFVSHCHTKSKREDFISELQKALDKYGCRIDVYGSCGPLKCPRDDYKFCYKKLKKDYYFYMSMENSFSEDYVTEKLLTALQYDTVPIVYGGANYSRFLPPNSYIDARKHNVSSLAAIMDQLIRSPSQYAEYFRWKPVYKYMSPQTTINVCGVCAALNNKELFSKKTVNKNFRKWWLGSDIKTRC